ncbi:MAG TPA: isoaspartyl peptidase/L-asparaginase, partial [Burkholderiales bacterium]
MSHPYALAVHGGAGRWPEDRLEPTLEGVRRAAQAARRILAAGGTALDAVVEAVAALEDDPLFNAGTGAALNAAGEAEMDAAVASGTGFGAVAALAGVRNPVRVARKVMEETDHLLLAGEGARRFARAMGFASHDPVTAERRAEYLKWREEGVAPEGDPPLRLRGLLERHPELAGGTVGAVARDRNGSLAAATSTGGLFHKLPGRVGDTPVPGAGTFASSQAAASATGHGETILRVL